MQLGFDDAIYRADGNALGRIVVAYALNTSSLIDHIQSTITFSDGFGGAIGNTRTAGDAIILDLHGHGSFSFSWFDIFPV